ncbi:hypothetical protein [Acinetobacter colistiniresistens]|uniref:Uncharacterized protein n=1 Tax=Acinetobacter colistiniresistens TaxID=280145 RepID=A0A558F952_9GAMM|nr:hypothetical protein [Acinetobacter colistiniresistens]TVT82135.1 hypothetical protein FPV60_09485 [Acinetobacter colistiniresistens]
MNENLKSILKITATFLVILFALPAIFKMLGLLWDGVVYLFDLYVQYIDLYFKNAEASTAIASGILGFLFVILFAVFMVYISDSGA